MGKIFSKRKSSITRRLLCALLMISLVPILGIGTLTFFRTYLDIEKKVGSNASHTNYQSSLETEKKIENYDDTAKAIITSDQLQHMYKLGRVSASDDYFLVNDLENDFLYYMSNNPHITAVCFYPQRQSTPILVGSYTAVRDYKKTSMYLQTVKEFGKSIFSVHTDLLSDYAEKGGMVVSRAVSDKFTGNLLGVLVMVVDPSEFADIYTKIYDGSSQIYIVNAAGETISSNQLQKMSSTVDRSMMANIVQQSEKQSFGYFRQSAGGNSYLVSFAQVDSCGWYIIDLQAYSTIMEQAMETLRIVFIIILLCITAAFITAYFVMGMISQPMHVMLGSMKKVENGDFDVTIHETFNNEFGILIKGFNTMVFKIKELIGKEKKALFLSMQVQINPHFLYNTLDSVNWMADAAGEDEISVMVTSLAKMCRLSLNDGRNVTTVRNEIEHVKSYLEIQRLRYNGSFTVDWHVEDSVLDCSIIKVVLQPIVENSLVHGFSNHPDNCHIDITIRQCGDILSLEIRDNGSGMTEAQLRECCLHHPKAVGHSYALYNISERIRLFYGENYGMVIQSESGKGTNVVIRIPHVESDEQ